VISQTRAGKALYVGGERAYSAIAQLLLNAALQLCGLECFSVDIKYGFVPHVD
jgi:hypothetical protein